MLSTTVFRFYEEYHPTTPLEDDPPQAMLSNPLQAIPVNRVRTYDIRSLLDTLLDTTSFLELRQGYGKSLVTGFGRLEGRPVAVLASDNCHLSGAIDADSALKAARFMELADAYDIPLLFLVDCPGFMVGPSSEEEGSARKMSQLFVIGASLTVPCCTVVLRKAYGLGAMALTGGRHMGPAQQLCVAWPSGEFGGMGLEGAVKLGFQKELAKARAEGGEEAEKGLYDRLVAGAYEQGKALNNAMKLEIDDVIDPMETRQVVLDAIHDHPGPKLPRKHKKRPAVGVW